MTYTLHIYDGTFIRSERPKQFIRLMEQSGYMYSGTKYGPQMRRELQGQPKFKGILGPMWDGDSGIRYECPKTYESLSS